MKAGSLEAPTLTAGYHRTELEVERRWWAIWWTAEALFCRAYPSFSSYFYNLLGENAADELDD